MDAQTAYERIRKHFSKPGAVYGWDERLQGCVYRKGGQAYSKVKCAVGCLIPNNRYFDIDEEWSPSEVAQKLGWADPFSTEGNNLIRFLEEAQNTHDKLANEAPMSFFIQKLDALAQSYGLRVVSAA